MSKRVESLSQLKHGQRVVALKPTILGTVSIGYEQFQKGKGWTSVPPPSSPRPDVRRQCTLVENNKSKSERTLSDPYIRDGLLAANGPCKHCDSLGLVRDPKSGEHKQCKLCYGGWLSG